MIRLSCLLNLEKAGQLMLLFLKKEGRCGAAVCFDSGESTLTNGSNHYSCKTLRAATLSRTKVNIVQQPVSNSSQNRRLGKSTRTRKHTWCFARALPQASSSHGPFRQTTETSRVIQGISSFILAPLLASSCYKATSYPWPLSVFYFAYAAGEAWACFH